MQINVLGVGINKVTMQEALQQIAQMINDKKPHLVVTANSEMIMRANEDPLLFQVIDRADLVVPDGIGVVWASRLLRKPLVERVPGIELMDNLLAMSAQSGWRVYFLGAEKGVAEKAVQNALQEHPKLQVAGVNHGFFKKGEETALLNNIKASQTDILFIALGIPKQEKWAAAYLAQLGVPVAVGVGGSMDVLAGTTKRAPRWMQQSGIEWLFRLIQQPKRIWRMAVLPHFVIQVLIERLVAKDDHPNEKDA